MKLKSKDDEKALEELITEMEKKKEKEIRDRIEKD